jgi:ankyrin repeat protein
MAQRQREKKPDRFRKTMMRLMKSSTRSVRRMLISKQRREELDKTLISAAWRGDNEKVLRLIKAGANIAAKEMYGYTALHNAAENGNTKTCAFLLNEYAKLGGNVKKLIIAKDNDGNAALYRAELNKHNETALFLRSMEWLVGATGNAFMKSFSDCVAA